MSELLSSFRKPSILDADWRAAPKNLFDLGGLGLGENIAAGVPISAVATTPNKEGIFGGFLQGKNADGSTYGGWGQAGMGILQGGSNLFMGMKNYGLMRDQLDFQKKMANQNYGAQKTLTNNTLEAQNIARAASREGATSPYKPLNLIA